MSDFDTERYSRKNMQQQKQLSSQPSTGVDDSRQRILDLIAKRDKNADTTAKEYYAAKMKAEMDQKRAQNKSDRGWGKAAMLGTSIGSMLGSPLLGAGVGALFGLGKASASRGGGLEGVFESLGDVKTGLIDPVLENPLMAVGAATSAAPYVMGDKADYLMKLLGGGGQKFGELGSAAGYLPQLSLDPEYANLGLKLNMPGPYGSPYYPGSLGGF